MDIVHLLAPLFLVCLIYFYFYRRKSKKFPPGPIKLPIIGNLLQLGFEPYRTVMKMRERYGDLIGIQLGSQSSIFINDLQLMKEAFSLNVLSGRPGMRHNLDPNDGKRIGIIFNTGADWVEQRRFVLKNLGDFGFGKRSMETLMQEDVQELIENICKMEEQSVDTCSMFRIPVVNSLWSIVSGERCAHDDPKINKLISLMLANTSSAKAVNIGLPFPWMSYLAPELSGYNEYMKNLTPVHDYIQESINYHKETYQKGIRRNLMDCYLEMGRKESAYSSFKGNAGDRSALFSIYDLFLGGIETTSTTLVWTCFLLAHFPEIQEKLSKNIIENIGSAKIPSLNDRPKLPYVEAFIMEIMRVSSLVPLGGGHVALEDVYFHGFEIPKGTLVFGNQFAVMHDPKIWGDPEKFRPERFLKADGTKVVKHEALIPFGIGKRSCLAETMGKDLMFLFTTSLFQRFKVEFDRSAPIPEPGDSVYAHFVISPKYHRIVFCDILK